MNLGLQCMPFVHPTSLSTSWTGNIIRNQVCITFLLQSIWQKHLVVLFLSWFVGVWCISQTTNQPRSHTVYSLRSLCWIFDLLPSSNLQLFPCWVWVFLFDRYLVRHLSSSLSSTLNIKSTLSSCCMSSLAVLQRRIHGLEICLLLLLASCYLLSWSVSAN